MRATVKLNLGCGPIQPAGWVNVDGSNRAWLASRFPRLDALLVRCRVLPPTEFGASTVYVDLLRDLPWDTGAVNAIYMGELLEHLEREAGEVLVRECHRILGPGGVLRIRVPDHAGFWRHYIEEFDRDRARPRKEWTLSHVRWTEMFFHDICVRRPRPWQSMGHYHKWMYDELSLIALLESQGFGEVERMPFRTSRIPEIESVEARDDLIVEGLRP